MSLSDQTLQFFPVSARVSVLRARGLRIKGKDGTNDAYTALQAGRETFRTPVAEKRAEPVWGGDDASFIFTLPAESARANQDGVPVLVRVLHRVPLGADKLLGLAVINVHELRQNGARENPQWFKLLNKAGKADKERGEVLLDIQFLKSSMSVSMIDLSDKSHSRLGKFKDKLRGKKKDGLSDSASAILPSVNQVLTDSEGEMDGETEGELRKKKKNKLKSLFVPKSNMKRNSMSQSMSSLGTLPDKNSSISSSTSSGLNVESSEGKKKKKFPFLTHKRNGSTDSKASNHSDFTLGSTNRNPPSQTDICINGSHVYREETQSEEVQEMEEEEEEEEEEGDKEEEEERWRREDEERERLEEERRQAEEERKRKEKEKQSRMEEEEKERIRKEREKEEHRRRIEEEEKERIRVEREMVEQRRIEEEEKERIRLEREKEEQKRRMDEVEKERIRMEREKEEQRRKLDEEKKERIIMEREIEEQRRRIEEEDKERIRIEREKEEQKRRMDEEEKERIKMEKEKEEQRRKMAAEKERIRIEMEKEEERIRKEEKEKERIKMEREIEEQRRIEEEDKERIRIEREKEEQKRRMDEEEKGRIRLEREKEEQRRRMEEEEKESQRRKLEEEERMRMKQENEEQMRKLEEERRREEEREAEELRRKMEEKAEEEEKIRIAEEERMNEEKKRAEKDRMMEEKEKKKEEKRIEMERRLANEKKAKEEEERRIAEEKEKQRKEQERVREEKERKRVEMEIKRKEEQERRNMEIEEKKKKEKQMREEQERNLFEESVISQSTDFTRSARISNVKPSMSISATVSQPTMVNTNPFLDDDLDTSISENISVEETTAKKGRAPLPPQSTGPDVFSRSVPKLHSHLKDVSKRPAPQPPGVLEMTREVTAKENTDQAGLGQRAKKTPERHHESKVSSVFQDDTQIDINPFTCEGAMAINDLTDDPSRRKEHLENIVEADSAKPNDPLCVNMDLCPESLVCKTDGLPSMERSQKKSRAPLPPTIPKRTGDPSTPHQQECFSSKTILEQAKENHINKKDQDNASVSSVEIPAVSTPSSSTVSSSTVSQHAEKSQVIPCTTDSVETGSGSGSRTLSWAKVVPNDAGEVREQVAPTSVIRQHAVKPLSAAENQPENYESRVPNNTQPKTKAAEEGMKGPYSQLTQPELISLALRQQEQISQRDARILELEQYIDSLLVRVMEEKPSILMTMNTKNKSM